MKIKIMLILVAAAVILAIGSCSLFSGMSIEERIDQFQSDLNTSDRSDIIDNFSKDCDSYNEINTSSYWNDGSSIFDVSNRPFSISVSVSGDTATGTMVYTTSSTSCDIRFEMVDEGFIDGWKILSVYITKDGNQEEKEI